MAKLKHSIESTRDHLISCAKRLFAKQGFSATSVREISDDANVNISLVSYHFGGKEGLYKACLEEFAKEKISFLESRILKPTSKEDFKLRMKFFIEEILENEIRNPEAGCIIRRDVETGDPMLLEIFRKTVLNLFDTFISFIKSGQDAGYIRKDLKAEAIASLFMGSIHHEIRTDKIKEKYYHCTIHDPVHRAEIIHTALEMFFNGVEI